MRIKSLREQIAQEQTEIENLKHYISESGMVISKTVQDQYSILRIAGQDIECASSRSLSFLTSLNM